LEAINYEILGMYQFVSVSVRIISQTIMWTDYKKNVTCSHNVQVSKFSLTLDK